MGEVTGTIKTFFEVFPTLKAEEELAFLFRDVEVKKITTNSSRDFLHVHIFSHHVIQKKQIHRMEQRIKEQLFGTARVSIRIEEKYALSEQYTPQALMEEYRESILEELREYSLLSANMLDQAEIRFEGEKGMCLELVDTIVSEGKRDHIVRLLEEVFNQRFQIPTEIRVSYRECEESRNQEFDEQRIQREINAIFARNKKHHEELGDLPKEEQTGSTADAAKESGTGKEKAAASPAAKAAVQ